MPCTFFYFPGGLQIVQPKAYTQEKSYMWYILSTSPLSPCCTEPSCIVSFTLNDDNGETFGSRS